MKFISAITTAIMVLAMQTFLTADVHAAPPPAKPLPAKVESKIQAALAGITDFTDSAAVTAAVMSAIKGNGSYAPEIVAYAVSFVGQKLINNPAAANNVIPAFVLAATKNQPRLTTEIVGQAVAAVPARLRDSVIPQIASTVIDAAPNKKAKAEVLNAVAENSRRDPTVTRSLDVIAAANGIAIVRTEVVNNGLVQPRYFIDDAGVSDFNGDQGTSTLGAFGGSGSSGGGGNPGNTANSPNNNPAS